MPTRSEALQGLLHKLRKPVLYSLLVIALAEVVSVAGFGIWLSMLKVGAKTKGLDFRKANIIPDTLPLLLMNLSLAVGPLRSQLMLAPMDTGEVSRSFSQELSLYPTYYYQNLASQT